MYFGLVVGFTFFYTDVLMQQQNMADTLQKQGGFIPGIRPGQRTQEYIMAVSRRIGLTQRLLAAPEVGSRGLGEVGSLVRVVVLTSVTIQSAIALLLIPRFLVDESPGPAIWHGAFYAVSAFNNAGFVPTSEGLAPYAGDWWVCVPLMLGVFIGALGFPVIHNLARTGWSSCCP